MNVTEIIDQVHERSENIKGSSADYADRRLRLLDYLREVEQEIWYLRDWVWKLKRTTAVVPGGTHYVKVPDDFASFGPSGGVYQDMSGGGDGIRFDLLTESEILDERERPNTGTNPHVFSLFDRDPTTFQPLIQMPSNVIDVPIAIWYQPLAPEIDEGANVNNIKLIPERFHQLVLIPGVRYKARESKSDDRWKNSLQEYERGKQRMLTEETRWQGRVRQLPSFFGARAR